jgi:hypothetical protein
MLQHAHGSPAPPVLTSTDLPQTTKSLECSGSSVPCIAAISNGLLAVCIHLPPVIVIPTAYIYNCERP